MGSYKHFLTGLSPSPPPDHVWQEWLGHSLYSADQHRSTWHRHSHDCTQITMALSPATVRAEWQEACGLPKRRELSGDMVWIIPPGVSHSVWFDRQASLLHLYLDNQFFGRVTADEAPEVAERIAPALLVRDSLLIELARDVSDELRHGPLNELYSQSVAALVASHLIRRYSSGPAALDIYRGGLGPARERRVRDYIEEHLEQKLTLTELAAVVDIGASHFASLFRQTTGMSPHRFVVRRRVERACRLMQGSRLTLVEIAMQCGFQDQSQFTTTFRRTFGVSPGKYRRGL